MARIDYLGKGVMQPIVSVSEGDRPSQYTLKLACGHTEYRRKDATWLRHHDQCLCYSCAGEIRAAIEENMAQHHVHVYHSKRDGPYLTGMCPLCYTQCRLGSRRFGDWEIQCQCGYSRIWDLGEDPVTCTCKWCQFVERHNIRIRASKQRLASARSKHGNSSDNPTRVKRARVPETYRTSGFCDTGD